LVSVYDFSLPFPENGNSSLKFKAKIITDNNFIVDIRRQARGILPFWLINFDYILSSIL